MTDADADFELLERLVDEFAARCRAGAAPAVADYAAQYPELAPQLADLCAGVALMEELRSGQRVQRAAYSRRNALAAPPSQLGDFAILREIGRGGMGVVYEAEQQSLARRVAVKVLPSHVFSRPAEVERFQREAQTAARLHHSHIVPVFGVGEQNGLHYYVMPLVRGVGLDEVIAELRETPPSAASALHRGVRTPTAMAARLAAAKFPDWPATEAPCAADDAARDVAHLGLQAAEALGFAHDQGTLHRDIKPGNLIVDGRGVLYVADFGLARLVEGDACGGGAEVAGTMRYMAPEQLLGRADARSDLFALGLTLYELLTGEPYYATRDRVRAATAELGPSRPIPRDLDMIVRKCLADEPDKRYASAGDLAADLRRFLDDRPVRARRVSPWEHAWRWCRRNRALAATAALATLLLAVTAAMLATAHVRTRNAYAQTQVALDRTAATSQLALEMLDGLYRQLSPERVWMAWDANPAGQSCACVGLSTGNGSTSAVQRTAMQVQASQQTVALLSEFLAFYDRLAQEGGDRDAVCLQAAVASRRVGDICLCLGQLQRAEREYTRAVEKLTVLGPASAADPAIGLELARSYNEIGNVLSVRLQPAQAVEFHQKALATLDALTTVDRYERARTLYFLGSKTAAAAATRVRGQAVPAGNVTFQTPPGRYFQGAIRILEALGREQPAAPDCRLLLALCYRSTGPATGSAGDTSARHGRRRALEILEALAAEYPGVADYRYELIATYAWIPVSLFPWQGRAAVSAEDQRALAKALRESQRLVAQCPSVPHYAATQALILAKLATAHWRARRLAAAEEKFQQAFDMQAALVAKSPELPCGQQVFLEFLRLRLAELGAERLRSESTPAPTALDSCRHLLETCVANLTRLAERPELAGDRLTHSTLPLAREALAALADGNALAERVAEE